MLNLINSNFPNKIILSRDKEELIKVFSSKVPENLGQVTQIAAAYYHSLALLENGTVVAWGSNKYVELYNSKI